MVTDLVKNNIKDQYREFKTNLASEKGEFCIRCSRRDDNESPLHRFIHKISAVLIFVLIGSFLSYLISLN